MSSASQPVSIPITYKQWKNQNSEIKSRVTAIATTAGIGGVRIYDHILYPNRGKKTKIEPKPAPAPESPHPETLHHDVAVQTEPHHNIILYTSKPKPFLSWRMSANSGSSSDSNTDTEPYFLIRKI